MSESGGLGSGARSTSPGRPAKRLCRWDWTAVGLTSLATLYFAVLAFLNAHLFPVTYGVVATAEVLILAGVLLLVVKRGWRDSDALPVALLFVFALITVWQSLVNDLLFPDALRNVAILALFTMLGVRASSTVVYRTFAILSGATLGVLLIEILSTDLYVAIFRPASFFQNFRGFEIKSWDDSGLFGGATSFASRWSFGLLSHRSASIFTEQVSLANFAGVLTIMLITCWPSLSWRARLLHAGTLVVILLTNSSRTSTILAAVSVAAYALYPRLPRYGTLAVAPLLLLLAFVLIAFTEQRESDDLVGRISITVRILTDGDLSFWLGGRLSRATSMFDSGYGYLIASTTLLGLVALWLYVSMIVPQQDAAQKRCAYTLALYVFGNMLIGGTAIFAMKVAAPLWLLVGATAKRDGDR